MLTVRQLEVRKFQVLAVTYLIWWPCAVHFTSLGLSFLSPIVGAPVCLYPYLYKEIFQDECGY